MEQNNVRDVEYQLKRMVDVVISHVYCVIMNCAGNANGIDLGLIVALRTSSQLFALRSIFGTKRIKRRLPLIGLLRKNGTRMKKNRTKIEHWKI
jgi:hypothetical protein